MKKKKYFINISKNIKEGYMFIAIKGYSVSPALGVRFKYEQKQNLTERLYLIFSVLSNQTSTES